MTVMLSKLGTAMHKQAVIGVSVSVHVCVRRHCIGSSQTRARTRCEQLQIERREGEGVVHSLQRWWPVEVEASKHGQHLQKVLREQVKDTW
jgi:hypothetical protein